MTTRNLLRSLYFFLTMTLWTSELFPSTLISIKILRVHDTIPNPVKPDTTLKRYLALGDSYTIGQSVKVNERYPVQIVESLRTAGYNISDAEIIATSGWTTRNLLVALKDKEAMPLYDMVTLLIGVNNQYQGGSIEEYRTEFISLLKKAIRFAGNRPKRVFVLSIPDYSVTPFAIHADKEKIARELNAFNLLNKRISEIYQVNYLNITKESRKAAWDHTLIAYDDLHFSGKEYGIWTTLLVPIIRKVLQ
ncbi:MAG: GDSL-type esterase/lipase family protein [Chitinophagaceae bacterium]